MAYLTPASPSKLITAFEELFADTLTVGIIARTLSGARSKAPDWLAKFQPTNQLLSRTAPTKVASEFSLR